MPELPEVEVVRRTLGPRLLGRRIVEVAVHRTDLRETVDAEALAEAGGRRIRGIRRIAKYLLLDLESSLTVAVHLGMSGQLTEVASGAPRLAHEHVAFALEGERRLRLVDPRRFGLVLALPTEAVEEDRHFRHLGLEPFGDAFAGAALERLARGRRAPIKAFLMDSRRIAGVGNIYASEALYRAGIHPRRAAGRISAGRWERLASAIREVLGRAIDEGGTTLSDFVDGGGESGRFQTSLDVYGREGDPCPGCGARILRIVQGNRSTYYCGRCQR